MDIMTHRVPKGLALLLVGGLVLAACDEGSVLNSGIATLGQDFVNAFSADANNDPINAQDVTLNLTPRIEPFDL